MYIVAPDSIKSIVEKVDMMMRAGYPLTTDNVSGLLSKHKTFAKTIKGVNNVPTAFKTFVVMLRGTNSFKVTTKWTPFLKELWNDICESKSFIAYYDILIEKVEDVLSTKYIFK